MLDRALTRRGPARFALAPAVATCGGGAGCRACDGTPRARNRARRARPAAGGGPGRCRPGSTWGSTASFRGGEDARGLRAGGRAPPGDDSRRRAAAAAHARVHWRAAGSVRCWPRSPTREPTHRRALPVPGNTEQPIYEASDCPASMPSACEFSVVLSRPTARARTQGSQPQPSRSLPRRPRCAVPRAAAAPLSSARRRRCRRRLRRGGLPRFNERLEKLQNAGRRPFPSPSRLPSRASQAAMRLHSAPARPATCESGVVRSSVRCSVSPPQRGSTAAARRPRTGHRGAASLQGRQTSSIRGPVAATTSAVDRVRVHAAPDEAAAAAGRGAPRCGSTSAAVSVDAPSTPAGDRGRLLRHPPASTSNRLRPWGAAPRSGRPVIGRVARGETSVVALAFGAGSPIGAASAGPSDSRAENARAHSSLASARRVPGRMCRPAACPARRSRASRQQEDLPAAARDTKETSTCTCNARKFDIWTQTWSRCTIAGKGRHAVVLLVQEHRPVHEATRTKETAGARAERPRSATRTGSAPIGGGSIDRALQRPRSPKRRCVFFCENAALKVPRRRFTCALRRGQGVSVPTFRARWGRGGCRGCGVPAGEACMALVEGPDVCARHTLDSA